MFCAYRTNASYTVANVLADIAKLAAGETNLANLSASCDQANTSIINTIPAGWTNADAGVAAGKLVLSCPDADNVTTKYMMLDWATATSPTMLIYESWNATTHTGTNSTASQALGSVTQSAVLFIYLWITPRYFFVTLYQSAAWKPLVGVSEIKRSNCFSSYYAAGNLKPVHVLNNGVGTNCTRAKTSNGTGEVLAAGASNIAAGSFCLLAPITTYAVYPPRNVDESVTFVVNPLYVAVGAGAVAVASLVGQIWDLYGISGVSGAATLDEVVFDSKTYQIVATSYCGIALFKG